MLRKKRETVEWLEFEIFQQFPELQHGVFLQRPSEEQICNHFDCHSLVVPKLVHGVDIQISPPLLPCDGVMTKTPGEGVLVTHADCQAVIFYDPVEKGMSLIHAGWRGNVNKIYTHTIGAMKKNFGSKPENLFVAISPSLGPCCGEFIHYEREIPKEFWAFQIRPLYFDLWEMARFQLEEAGILPHHLEISPKCTRCSPENFHSYRRTKSRTDQNATVAVLSF